MHPGTVSLTAGHCLLLVLGGLAAGAVNGVAGGGSLISFPLLLALGYPALTANVTNTVGIWPGYVGGAAGFGREIAGQRSRILRLTPIAAAGSVAGALLLLTTSSRTFKDLAPWLVLAASALFTAQPVLRRALGGSSHAPERPRPVLLAGGTFVTSVYGGYFGAGLGVMLLALLGLALPDSIVRTSGLRTALSMFVNGVAAVVFTIHGSLAWGAVGLLALGSLGGGRVGAAVALWLPAAALRALVVGIGVATVIVLLA